VYLDLVRGGDSYATPLLRLRLHRVLCEVIVCVDTHLCSNGHSLFCHFHCRQPRHVDQRTCSRWESNSMRECTRRRTNECVWGTSDEPCAKPPPEPMAAYAIPGQIGWAWNQSRKSIQPTRMGESETESRGLAVQVCVGGGGGVAGHHHGAYTPMMPSSAGSITSPTPVNVKLTFLSQTSINAWDMSAVSACGPRNETKQNETKLKLPSHLQLSQVLLRSPLFGQRHTCTRELPCDRTTRIAGATPRKTTCKHTMWGEEYRAWRHTDTSTRVWRG